MREAGEQDKERLLEYLRKGLHDCLYFYIDVMNYGIASENMKVWIEEERGEIVLAVMKYYDSFQVYSHSSQCKTEQVLELLHQYPVAMISARKDIIQQMEGKLVDYKAEYGVVYLMDKYRKIGENKKVQLAVQEDVKEIAELICSDEELGEPYTVESLTSQLAERIRTQTGRSYIIRENGEIAAHSATYAEAEGIAVVSGTIVKAEYRNTNCYMILANYMMQELVKEEKSAYTFSLSAKMQDYLDKVHTRCGEYGRLVMKTGKSRT